MSANYDLYGTGAIGLASTGEYNSSIFYRHKISLNNNGTVSIAIEINSTKISLATNVIIDINEVFQKTIIKL